MPDKTRNDERRSRHTGKRAQMGYDDIEERQRSRGGNRGGEQQLVHGDVEEIKERTRVENMEIKASLERADRCLQQTMGLAAETGGELKKQTEIIREIDGKVEYCNAELDDADVMINEIDSWWSMFNPFKSKKKSRTVSKWGSTSEPPSSKNKKFDKNLEKPTKKTAEPQNDTDVALDRMSKNLAVLKDHSLQMGQELDYQNNTLERMNPKMQKLNQRLQKTSEKVKILC